VGAVRVREDLATLPGDDEVGRRLRRLDGGCWVPRAPWRFEADGSAQPAAWA
jgi:hypothetical protein